MGKFAPHSPRRGHKIGRVTGSRTRATVAGLVALAFVILGSASAALAKSQNGGADIASAPQLPLGVKTASGWALAAGGQNTAGGYGEYWRLKMNAGDRLVFDWALTQSECSSGAEQGVEVFAPKVTDYTVDQAHAVAYDSFVFKTKTEFRWVAPSSGNWIFDFYGCQTFSYTFLAHLQAFTRIHLVAPSLVGHGHKVAVSGRVEGVQTGKVAVMVRRGRVLLTTKVVSLTRRGRFKVKLTFSKPGKDSLKVAYYGDSKHRPSKASATIHVA